MIYRIELQCVADTRFIFSDLSVKIHGAIMNNIPKQYADKFHSGNYQPFSIYTIPAENGFKAVVSALTDDAAVIIAYLQNCSSFVFYGADSRIVISDCRLSGPFDIKSAIFSDNRTVLIKFLSPAIYKNSGEAVMTPDISRYFVSVINKLKGFEGIDYSADTLNSVFRKLRYKALNLNNSAFNVSGTIYNGLLGNAEIFLPETIDEKNMLLTIFNYANYSGVGAKTGLGMGAFDYSANLF